LGVGLVLVIRAAMPIFRRVFRKYDALNDSVQENVQAMRVVKSYVREDYEKKKFAAAAADVCNDFTKAERIMAISSPMMQFCVYAGMAFVLSYGSYLVITSQGGEAVCKDRRHLTDSNFSAAACDYEIRTKRQTKRHAC